MTSSTPSPGSPGKVPGHVTHQEPYWQHYANMDISGLWQAGDKEWFLPGRPLTAQKPKLEGPFQASVSPLQPAHKKSKGQKATVQRSLPTPSRGTPYATCRDFEVEVAGGSAPVLLVLRAAAAPAPQGHTSQLRVRTLRVSRTPSAALMLYRSLQKAAEAKDNIPTPSSSLLQELKDDDLSQNETAFKQKQVAVASLGNVLYGLSLAAPHYIKLFPEYHKKYKQSLVD
ncbi:hypothetical protein P7K49_017269 [Saguinus oedipus]|uniref:Uncharacterized protein n=1 Tax=Saguinus oedipus TaxID=9490 RepID=A0ABQ9V200_SAGOE|nr:hypothetical protein P7K49_017269 [Saguinus oedipus]